LIDGIVNEMEWNWKESDELRKGMKEQCTNCKIDR